MKVVNFKAEIYQTLRKMKNFLLYIEKVKCIIQNTALLNHNHVINGNCDYGSKLLAL